VTVCIAALCEEDKILGAADRMQTAGDMQFEPPKSKIMPVTTSIVLMMSSDSNLDSEIRQYVLFDINARIERDPGNWWLVRDVAELYQKYYNLAKTRRIQNALLAPFGLDATSFISRQKDMSKEFLESFMAAISSFSIPSVHVIVAGNDTTGAHVYTVIDGEVSCWDTAGFVSIGAGFRHVQSQFMYSRHTPKSLLADTLWLTYHAKRRSEVAPGVGAETDMFLIGPKLGSYTSIGDEVVERLRKFYEDTTEKENQVKIEAINAARGYMQEIQDGAKVSDKQSGVDEAHS